MYYMENNCLQLLMKFHLFLIKYHIVFFYCKLSIYNYRLINNSVSLLLIRKLYDNNCNPGFIIIVENYY